MFRFKRVSLLVCVALLAALVAPTLRAQSGLTDVQFFLTYIPNIQFSPVYMAQAKGYFEQNGFNVTVEYGDESVGVDLVAAGERQFGIFGGEQVITARANQRPVVFVYEWFQRFPVGVVTSAESGIETFADLAGRRVGVPGRFGASYSGLRALLTASGMSESDLQVEEIGFNAPEVVCIGAIDASVIYINNEPLQIQARAAAGDCGGISAVRVLPVADVVDLVSNGIVTNEQTLTEQPEQVRAFVAAFDAGLRAVINNPAETYLLSVDYIENLPLSDALRAALETEAEAQAVFLADNPDWAAISASRAALAARLRAQLPAEDLLQFEVLLATIDLWDADQLGLTEAASWDATQATLIEMGFVETPMDLAGAFTNAFLPEN